MSGRLRNIMRINRSRRNEKTAAVTIDKLPDDILVHVFSFLCKKDLVMNIKLTSKRWKALSEHPILWREIDFRREDFSVQAMITLARMKFHPGLTRLYFKGYLSEGDVNSEKWLTSQSIRIDLIEELNSKCRSIVHLGFVDLNIQQLNVTYMPETLKELSCIDCRMSRDWFQPIQRDQSPLQLLETINLSGSTGVGDQCLGNLADLVPRNLTTLKLNRITMGGSGLEQLSIKVNGIENLELNSVYPSRQCLNVVLDHWTALKTLSLDNVPTVGNLVIDKMTLQLPLLHTLILSKCSSLTPGCIESFAHFLSLRHLDVSNTQLSSDNSLEELRSRLSEECELKAENTTEN